MHCNFTYPTNAFYLKFCKIKNSIGYEGNRILFYNEIGVNTNYCVSAEGQYYNIAEHDKIREEINSKLVLD